MRSAFPHCSPRPARWRLALAGAWLIAAAGGCERTTKDTDIKLIRVAEVKSLVDKQARGEGDLVLLIDPRPKKYYDTVHIPGARNLTLPQVEPKAKVDPVIDKYRTLIVYGDDPASAEARGMTKRLMAVGYSGVRFFAGGLWEWNLRGYAVEGNQGPPTPPESSSATPPSPPAEPKPGDTPPAASPPAPVTPPPSTPP